VCDHCAVYLKMAALIRSLFPLALVSFKGIIDIRCLAFSLMHSGVHESDLHFVAQFGTK